MLTTRSEQLLTQLSTSNERLAELISRLNLTNRQLAAADADADAGHSAAGCCTSRRPGGQWAAAGQGAGCGPAGATAQRTDVLRSCHHGPWPDSLGSGHRVRRR